MTRIIDKNELTPIEEYHGILFKRDDLFLPFNDLKQLGGTKVRSMIELNDLIKKSDKENYKGLITYTQVDSPQGLIIAKIAQINKIPSIICIGSNSEVNKSIQAHKSLKYAKKCGAEIIKVSGLGYNNVLSKKAKDLAKVKNYNLVHFGISMNDYPEAIINSVANQVQNIPENLDNLIIPCGSGITMGGILVGLSLYNKNIKNVIGIQISGYNRIKEINKIMDIFKVKYDYKFHIDTTYPYSKNISHHITPHFDLSAKYESKSYKY